MAENADHATGQKQETPVSSPPQDGDRPATQELPPVTPAQRSKRIRFILLGLLILALAVGVPYGWQLWQYYRSHESTDDAYVTGDIIPISARVSGTILSVLIEENQSIEAGQLLAQLDPRDFETKVQQAEAAVAVEAARMRQAEIEVVQEQDSTSSDTARTSATLRAAQSAVQEARHGTDEARARLRTLGAAVTVAQAEVDARNARLDMARTAFTRAKQLLNDGVVAQQQYDETQSTLQAAEAERRMAIQKLALAQREVEQGRVDLLTKRQSVERARAGEAEAQALLAGSQAMRQNVDIKQAEVDVIRARLQQKQADLDYARLQLNYTMLRAPVWGVIAKNNIQIGQVVQPGRPLMALVPLQHV